MEPEQRLKKAIATGASILENRGQGRAAKLMRCDWRCYFPSDSFNNNQCNVIFEVPVKIYEVVRPEKDDLEGVVSSAINEASGDDCELCFSAILNPKWVDYEKWRSSVFRVTKLLRASLMVLIFLLLRRGGKRLLKGGFAILVAP